MHEHVFVLSEEVRQNYPADWDEDDRVDDAVAKLDRAEARGCQTIVDPTVIGLGRDIGADPPGRGTGPAEHHRGHRPVHLQRGAAYFKYRGPARDDGRRIR